MSTISANKQLIKRVDDTDLKPETCNLKPKKNEGVDKEQLLVSMKEKAAILRHLQERDLVQEPDAKEIREILGDLDKTIKALETTNV